MAAVAPLVILPQDGTWRRTPSGAGVHMKLTSAATGGVLTVFETSRDPGDARAPRAHRHVNMDETFFVVEGSYVFELDGQAFDAPAGTIVFLPRGTLHRFRSSGTSRGRVLCIAAPGGIDGFFDAVADPNVRLEEAYRKHGFAFEGA